MKSEETPPKLDKPKRPAGRPPKLVLHIDDRPENIAKALFGIQSDTPGNVTTKRE